MLKFTLYVEPHTPAAHHDDADLSNDLSAVMPSLTALLEALLKAKAGPQLQPGAGPDEGTPDPVPLEGALYTADTIEITVRPWEQTGARTWVRRTGRGLVLATVDELLDHTWSWRVVGRGATGIAGTASEAMQHADAALTEGYAPPSLDEQLATATPTTKVDPHLVRLLDMILEVGQTTRAPIPVRACPERSSPFAAAVTAVGTGEHPTLTITGADSTDHIIELRSARVSGTATQTAISVPGWSLVFEDCDITLPELTPPAVHGGPDEAQTLLEQGAEAWGALVRTWAQNFNAPLDEDGKPTMTQPDRASALMTAMSGYSHPCFAYITERGGLAGACIDTVLRLSLASPEEAVRYGKQIAANIVQVGTAIGGFPLDQYMEKSMYSPETAEDDSNPSGGMVKDTVSDTNRPAELGTG